MKSRLSRIAWPTAPLWELAQIRTGVAKGGKQVKVPVELPYLRVANVQDGGLKLDEVKRITVDEADVSRYLLESGDVLMTEGGDFDKLGRAAIWQAEVEPCLHQNHVFAVRCDPEKVLPEWVSMISGSQYGRRYFQLCSKQSTNLASINSTQLKALPVPLPAVDEQARVIALLGKVESCAATLRELFAIKETFKRSLAQQLLTGKKRFPEFRDQPWSEVRLGEVFSERAEANRCDLPLLSVTGGRGVIPRDQLNKRDTSNADKSKYKRVTVGDIAYNTMRMWQGVSALSSLEGIVSPAYTVIVPSDRIDGGFARHLFKLPAVVHRFRRYSQGLVDDTLNLKYGQFARVRVRIPADLGEQRKIATVLDLCESELALLEQQREQYAQYKRGLMSRLLSGDIQVPA